MFDLDDYVVVELAVKRMEVVVGGFGAIILRVAPIEMMVVDKRAIKNDSAMRRKRACNHFGGVGGRASIGRWAEPALRICLDDYSRKIRNQPVNVVNFFLPPFGNARICRIKCVQTTDHFWAAEVDRDR